MVAGTVAGCADAVPEPTRVDDPARPQVERRAAVGPGVPRLGRRVALIDDEYVRIAREELPGFGGLSLDSLGTPVVYLKDLGQRGRAVEALGPILRVPRQVGQRGERSALTTLVVRQGQYDFAELVGWQLALNNVVFARPGVVFTDVDEGRNRLLVAVVDLASATSIRELAASVGVPSGALVVEQHAPLRLGQGGQSLRGQVRSPGVPAGVQIRSYANTVDGGGICSIGGLTDYSNAYPNNQANSTDRRFLTNSHCTAVLFGTDGSTAETHQPSPEYVFGVPVNLIGAEVADPPAFTNAQEYYCPALTDQGQPAVCRYSDVAMMRFGTDVPWELGRIFRPQAQNTSSAPSTNPTPGAFDVDPVTPRFRITSAGDHVGFIQGETIQKVGRTTGWTSGTITNTCLTFPVSQGGAATNKLLLCQVLTNAPSDDGDSGGVVFRWNSTGVTWLGVNWGVPVAAFSSWHNIYNDFGDFGTIAW